MRVHGETLHQILSQPLGCPAAKLRAAFRSHPVTDGQDGVEIVVLDLALHVAHALPSNYSEFPNSCLPRQLALVQKILQVLVDGRHRHLEQLPDERLA